MSASLRATLYSVVGYQLSVSRKVVATMVNSTVRALILDLIEWLALKERTYEETMDAWRTSCPKLPVWEDANDLGLIAIERKDGRSLVRVTAAGLELLRESRP